MIDVHSHIIFGVDDGPSCIEQSLDMIKAADRIGINFIMATPHFQEQIFDLNRVEENYHELLFRARDYDVVLNLAYEIFLDPSYIVQFNNRRLFSPNKSGFILLEFPFGIKPHKCIESIYKMDLQNITPVIAHIERNRSFMKDIRFVETLIRAGCYIQLDAASIIGVYGSRVKEFAKKLIKLRYVDMIASNAHCAEDYSNWYLEAYRKVAHWVGKVEAGMLFNYNAKGIIEDECEKGRVLSMMNV